MTRDVIGDEDLRRLADWRSHRMVVMLIEPRQATVGHGLERPHRTVSLPAEVTPPEGDGADRKELAAEITRITGRTPH
jgi:hypothetical protein